ncbi:MAG: hypothetical protein J0H88_19840 [Sphingomonadales bacterium]|nr:hypothetical protein [Sphingomonadales bacterium]
MNDIDSALSDIQRIRDRLADGTRFEGFAPGIVALTGVFAFALSAWQVHGRSASLLAWIILALVCALMIGTEAIVRARAVHRAMADRLINSTLQRFLPVGLAGAIVGFVILLQFPEQVRLLPGLWQLLMAVGICAALGNLPAAMRWPAAFYFVAGTISLAVSGDALIDTAWLMGLPFGIGQFLVAATLYVSSGRTPHD